MPLSEPSSAAGRGSYRRAVPSTAAGEPETPEPVLPSRLRVGIDLVDVEEVAATLRSKKCIRPDQARAVRSTTAGATARSTP